jgi:hypothetical protein
MKTHSTKKRGGKHHPGPHHAAETKALTDAHDVEVLSIIADEAGAEDAEHLQRVATAAYFMSQKRGFEPGHELDDWLAAEQEIAAARLQALRLNSNGGVS